MSGRMIMTRLLALAAALAIFAGAGPRPAHAAGQKAYESSLDGIRLVCEKTDGPLAAACVFVRTGSAGEDERNNGVTSLLNNLIISSNPATQPSAILEIEGVGGTVETETGPDYSCFRLIVPLKKLASALGALGRSVAEPPLNESSLRAARRQLISRCDKRRDDPVEAGYGMLLKRTYPESPYRLYPEGETDSLRGISLHDVSDWHAKHYVRENIVVSLCADLDGEQAERLVRAALAGIPGNPDAARELAAGPATIPASGRGRFELGLPATGSAALVSYAAPPMDSPDYAAVRLAEAVIAGGMGSRLFRSLRVDGKLSYSFGSIMAAASGPRLTFYAIADAGTVDAAAGCITSSVEALVNGELTDEELARAKGRATGLLAMGGEGLSERAWRLGLSGLMGLGQGYWEGLSERVWKADARDVVAAARKYMGGYTLVVLRPGDGKI